MKESDMSSEISREELEASMIRLMTLLEIDYKVPQDTVRELILYATEYGRLAAMQAVKDTFGV